MFPQQSISQGRANNYEDFKAKIIQLLSATSDSYSVSINCPPEIFESHKQELESLFPGRIELFNTYQTEHIVSTLQKDKSISNALIPVLIPHQNQPFWSNNNNNFIQPHEILFSEVPNNSSKQEVTIDVIDKESPNTKHNFFPPPPKSWMSENTLINIYLYPETVCLSEIDDNIIQHFLKFLGRKDFDERQKFLIRCKKRHPHFVFRLLAFKNIPYENPLVVTFNEYSQERMAEEIHEVIHSPSINQTNLVSLLSNAIKPSEIINLLQLLDNKYKMISLSLQVERTITIVNFSKISNALISDAVTMEKILIDFFDCPSAKGFKKIYDYGLINLLAIFFESSSIEKKLNFLQKCELQPEIIEVVLLLPSFTQGKNGLSELAQSSTVEQKLDLIFHYHYLTEFNPNAYNLLLNCLVKGDDQKELLKLLEERRKTMSNLLTEFTPQKSHANIMC